MNSAPKIMLALASFCALSASVFAQVDPTPARSKMIAQANPSRPVVIGVHVNLQWRNEKKQDELVEQLQKSGVKTVRTGVEATHFIIQAHQHGIGVLALVSPTRGATVIHPRPADKAAGLPWGTNLLSEANPAGFKKWITTQLAPLEAAGVHLQGFEVGNELNGPYFNGDFPGRARGRCLGLSDLQNSKDAEAARIARGFLTYLAILTEMKKVRGGLKFSKDTPILSFSMINPGAVRRDPRIVHDAVNNAATFEFLRSHGLDKLVDGYAVHWYPSNNATMGSAARLAQFERDILTARRAGAKPYWLTEWGFMNNDLSCPVKDEPRRKLIETVHAVFSQIAREGRLRGLTYYVWDANGGVHNAQYAIYRCGGLSSAGSAALRPIP